MLFGFATREERRCFEALIGALYLAQATTTVSTGQQLLQLESTRDYLQRTNEDIDAQIANSVKHEGGNLDRWENMADVDLVVHPHECNGG